jgi:hypothetical protein
MSLKDIREQVAAIVASVPSVGPVYSHFCWASTWQKFLDFFKDDDGKINGAMITRTRTPEIDYGGSGQDLRTHNMKVALLFGLNNAHGSEIYFQDEIVEAVCTALRGNKRLNGTATNCTPPAVEVCETRMFGSVLCHWAEISLAADEIEVFDL